MGFILTGLGIFICVLVIYVCINLYLCDWKFEEEAIIDRELEQELIRLEIEKQKELDRIGK